MTHLGILSIALQKFAAINTPIKFISTTRIHTMYTMYAMLFSSEILENTMFQHFNFLEYIKFV